MSHRGIVVAAVTQAAESTEYARGSIPTQTADCTAMAARPGWTASTTRDDEARSARNGSRDDGLVQARGHAARGADGRREAMFAVQRTDRLAMGRRQWLMRRPLELRDAVAMTNPTHAPKACRQVPASLGGQRQRGT